MNRPSCPPPVHMSCPQMLRQEKARRPRFHIPLNLRLGMRRHRTADHQSGQHPSLRTRPQLLPRPNRRLTCCRLAVARSVYQHPGANCTFLVMVGLQAVGLQAVGRNHRLAVLTGPSMESRGVAAANQSRQRTVTRLMNQAIKGLIMSTLPITTIQAAQVTSRRMIFWRWTITLASDIEI